MAEIKLNAEMRDSIGKNKVNKLRAKQIIPGVIYGKGEDTRTITVTEKDLAKVYTQAGTSTIVDIVIDGEATPVLLKEVQKHPYKNQYTHVDFYALNMKELLKINIPIVLEGRDEIKLQPSVLAQQMNEVEIECLPVDIPQSAVANVIDMQYGDQILVKDLDIFSDEKLTFLVDPEELVATLSEPREEEIEEEEEALDVDAADVPTVDETEEDSEETEE
ncbi:MAG: 50S ribosomal protein L25 [Tissierellia bacterium]|nr:50S ribosomal protein L25 [Tissierellia bacterium]